MFGVGDPSRALEVEMPRSRLTSVLVVTTPMDVAQDHEVFGYREYCFCDFFCRASSRMLFQLIKQ
jgi:hypothetical protein